MQAQRIVILLAFILLFGQGQVHAEVDNNKSLDTIEDVYDPLEGLNRAVFDVNWTIDRHFFVPLAEVYGFVPSPARKGVRNFLTNLKSPVTFVNDVLQLEVGRAGQTLARTIVNTTIGIGGLFDVATEMGMDYHSEDFGQTLAQYGLPSGPYLVVPILGPSTPRDLAGRSADQFINPVNWAMWNNDLDWLYYTNDGVYLLDRRTEARGFTDDLEKAIDPYARVRSLYWQSRVSNLGNEQVDDSDSPKPSDSE